MLLEAWVLPGQIPLRGQQREKRAASNLKTRVARVAGFAPSGPERQASETHQHAQDANLRLALSVDDHHANNSPSARQSSPAGSPTDTPAGNRKQTSLLWG